MSGLTRVCLLVLQGFWRLLNSSWTFHSTSTADPGKIAAPGAPGQLSSRKALDMGTGSVCKETLRLSA